MSHFEQRLETDLKAIRQWVWDLGEAVETAIGDAKKILVLRDEDLAYAETSPFEDADQIVIAVADRRVGGMALFRWDEERGEFAGHRVETVAS